MKVKWEAFRGYKQTSKVCFVYLECKLQEDSYVFASSIATKRYNEDI